MKNSCIIRSICSFLNIIEFYSANSAVSLFSVYCFTAQLGIVIA